MLLRDDHDPHHAGWEDAADSTLERRVYYVQNWRWDVVALLADNGRVLERAWHEPYGTPWGLPAADLTTSNTSGNDDYGVPDGDADASDQGYFDTLHAASSARADLTGSATSTDFDYGRPDGTVDVDDDSYYTDIKNAADTLGRGALSAEDGLRNRRGLSGYEWDGTHDKYHVRHRVLRPETGRWTRRDPIEADAPASLYQYTPNPWLDVDPGGLACVSAAGLLCSGAVEYQPPSNRDQQCFRNPGAPGCKDRTKGRCKKYFDFYSSFAASGSSLAWPGSGSTNRCKRMQAALAERHGYTGQVSGCRNLGFNEDDNCGETQEEKNEGRHCIVSCCLRSRTDPDFTWKLLELRECCSLDAASPSEDWNDFKEDWKGNLRGIDCDSRGEFCLPCCGCIAGF